MADINANIGVHIDTSAALAELKALQRQISAFHSSIAASANAANMATAAQMQRNLMQNIAATGKFSAEMTRVRSTSEAFTTALERNKLSMREYFRYAGASTKTFGRLFRSEFDVIEKTARERVKTLQTQYIKMGRDANGAIKAIKVRPLALDMQNLATQTAMAAQKQQLFNQLLKQGTTNLLNWGKNTQWAGRQLMVGFTLPLTMLGVTAIRTFKEIETQAIRFRRVYGELFTTEAETNKMLKSLKDLGMEFTKYGVSLEKTLSLAADAAAMGKMGADLLAQVNEANRLAVLGGVEQEQALETTISLTNAFGIAAEDLTNKIDFLNAVENQTVTSIEDLTIAIPKAGPVIQQLGGDVEDLAFFLTAMKEGGINASEGANALKSGLASLINPTDKASEMLAGFGINIKGIVEANAGDVKGTVIAFAQALDTLDPLNRARAIEQLFGKFQFARLSTLFQNVIAEGTQAERVLELSRATAEQLKILSERELAKIEESPMFKLQKAIEDLQITLAPLGEEFIKLLTPIIEFGTQILDNFNKLDSGAKQFIMGLVAVLGLIAPAALMTIGLVGNGIANLLKGFNALRLFYQKLTGGTQQLGVTTQYMTQEQLEAAAVAASLGQSHAQLAQIFTSEAAAVQQLTAAYNAAIAAQNRLMGGGKMPKGGMPKPTIKAQKGLVMVPGTGKGDKVPALLEPGEAIIPAAIAKENRGFIAAMIEGSIRGYNGGTDEVKKGKVQGFTNAVISLLPKSNIQMESGTLPATDLAAQLKGKPAAASPLLYGILENMGMNKKQIDASLKDPKVRAALTKFATGVTGGIATAVSKQGGNIDQKTFARLATPIVTAQAAELDKVLPGASKAADTTLKKTTTVRSLLRLRQKSDGKLGLIPERAPLQKGLASYGSTRRKQSVYGFMESLFPGSSKEMRKRNLGHITESTNLSPEQARKLGQGKLTAPAAAAVSAAERGKVIIRKEDKTLKKGVRRPRIEAPIGISAADAAKQFKADEKITKNSGTRAKNERSIARSKKESAKADTKSAAAQKGMATARSQTTQRGKGKIVYNEKLKRYQNSVTKEIVSNEAGRRSLAAQKAAETRAANRAARQQAVVPPAPQEPTTGRQPGAVMRGVGAGAAVAGVAAMGLSFVPGQIGEIASQLIMPLMMLPMLIPMLANPIGLAVLAIGGLVAGVLLLNNAMNEATKAGIALGNSMGTSNDKLIEMSEVTGTVSASEEARMRRQDQITKQDTEGRQFGQTYLESEAGKSLIADINTQLAEGRGVSQTGKNIGLQLAYAIAQGVIDAEQGRSIAAALGQELGDYSIAAKIAGTISSIVGPNGEDLINEPLTVALRISQQSMKDVQDFATATLPQIRDLRNPDEDQGVFGNINDYNEAVKLSAALLQYNTQIVQQQQGQLDWLQQNYTERRAILETEIATAEASLETTSNEADKLALQTKISTLKAQINTLNNEEKLSLKSIREENNKNYSVLVNQTKELQNMGLLANTLDESLKMTYQEGTPEFVRAKNALDQIKAISDKDLQVSLALNFLSGEMSPEAITTLIASFAKNQQMGALFGDVVSQQGLANANQILTLLSVANLAPDQPAFGSIFGSFLGIGDDQFQDRLDALAQITSIATELGINIDLNVMGNEQIDRVMKNMNALEKLPDPITKEAFASFRPTDPALYSAIMSDWDRLSNADGTINRSIVINASATGDWGAVQQYLIATGQYNKVVGGKVTTGRFGMTADALERSSGRLQTEVTQEQRAAAGVYFQPSTSKETQKATDEQEGYTDAINDTGGAANDVFSSILNDLKRVRDATINAAGGVKELMRILGGGKNISIFQGIEQQLTRQGMNEQFVDFIASLDPKEAKQFYEINKQGEIVLTKVGIAMKKAFDEKILGDFQLKQLQIVAGFKNQMVAVSKLVKAGVSLAAAYDIAADAALAAAIANGKISSEEWKELVATIKAAEAAAKRYAAAQAVADANQAVKDQQKILNWINQNAGMLNGDLIQGILADQDLQQLILLGGSITGTEAKAIKERLQQILDNAELQLKIKKLTIEGMEEIFNDGFNKAQEAFAAQEKAIDIEFQLSTQADQNIIQEAQDLISSINFEIDDLEAQLKGIEDQETKVNEKYDKRIDALDEIDKLNERIANKQKAQLTIADALTRGDISAAAKAIQDLRDQEASAQSASQRDLLNRSRQAELDALTAANGMTRKQIEDEIKNLKDEIFRIEEETLEPAQRRVELAEIEKREAIEQLTVLGMTRLEWEQIQNRIDLAKTSSDSYIEAITEAKNIVEDIINYWEELDGKEVNINQIINTIQNAPGTAPTMPDGATGGTGSGDTINNGGGGANLAELKSKATSLSKQINSEKQVLNSMQGSTIGFGKETINAQITKINGLIRVYNGLANQIKQLGDSSFSTLTMLNLIGSGVTTGNPSQGGISAMAMGGMAKRKYMPMGGMIPYKAEGGMSLGSDTVPAMLTPGEYVIRRPMVRKYGKEFFENLNNGTFKPIFNKPNFTNPSFGGLTRPGIPELKKQVMNISDYVYNYSVNVNVQTDANPDQIARAVMSQINRIDSMRLRGNRF